MLMTALMKDSSPAVRTAVLKASVLAYVITVCIWTPLSYPTDTFAVHCHDSSYIKYDSLLLDPSIHLKLLENNNIQINAAKT